MIPKLPFYFLLTFISVVASAQENLIEKAVPYRKGDKWGYADPFTGKMLCEAIYDSVGRSETPFLKPIFYKDGKVGILSTIDPQTPAKELVPADYIDGYRHYVGYLLMKKGMRYSYFDRNGVALAEDQKHIHGTHSEAGNQIPLLVVQGDEPFSTGIIDLTTNQFLFPKQYNFQDINFETAREFEKKLGKKVQTFLIQDKSNAFYALDIYFKPIPVVFKPDEKKTYQDTYNSMALELNVAYKEGAKAFRERCAAESTEYKSPKKKKYVLEPLCNGDFQLIRNVSTNEFGVVKKAESGQAVVVEPIYTHISVPESATLSGTFIVESKGKFGLISASGQVLPVAFDEILAGDRAFMARKGITTHFIMEYFDTSAQVDVDDVALAIEAKRLVSDDRSKGVMIILIKKTDGTHFYMGSDGKIFYEP